MAKRDRYSTELLVSYMVQGIGVHETARLVGCSRDAISQRKRRSDWQPELERQQRELVERVGLRFATGVDNVVNKLMADLVDDDWRCRHSAARMILESAGVLNGGINVGIGITAGAGDAPSATRTDLPIKPSDLDGVRRLVEQVREDSERTSATDSLRVQEAEFSESGGNGALPRGSNGSGSDTQE